MGGAAGGVNLDPPSLPPSLSVIRLFELFLSSSTSPFFIFSLSLPPSLAIILSSHGQEHERERTNDPFEESFLQPVGGRGRSLAVVGRSEESGAAPGGRRAMSED